MRTLSTIAFLAFITVNDVKSLPFPTSLVASQGSTNPYTGKGFEGRTRPNNGALVIGFDSLNCATKRQDTVWNVDRDGKWVGIGPDDRDSVGQSVAVAFGKNEDGGNPFYIMLSPHHYGAKTSKGGAGDDNRTAYANAANVICIDAAAAGIPPLKGGKPVQIRTMCMTDSKTGSCSNEGVETQTE
jgi:hypothetical protein